MRDYSDIIHRERPVHKDDAFSIQHPKMRRELRAKQFAPFDALTGFGETVEEYRAVTERPRELSDGENSVINEKLLQVQDAFLTWKKGRKGIGPEVPPPKVWVSFFDRDLRQEELHGDGARGNTATLTGEVTGIDAVGQVLQVAGKQIPFPEIYALRILQDR